MLDFLFPDPYGKPHAGSTVPGTFPDPSADRGKSDLSESGGQFCGTSVYLGAGSGQYRSQSDGNRGNAGFHSNRFRAVCTSPWDVYEHLEKKGIAVDRESGEIYRPKEPDVDES